MLEEAKTPWKTQKGTKSKGLLQTDSRREKKDQVHLPPKDGNVVNDTRVEVLT